MHIPLGSIGSLVNRDSRVFAIGLGEEFCLVPDGLDTRVAGGDGIPVDITLDSGLIIGAELVKVFVSRKRWIVFLHALG